MCRYLAAVRAVKTFIRTKSGKLIERIVFLSDEDYKKFIKGGGNASDVLKKYLTKEEAGNLDSWDKEEVMMSYRLNYQVIQSMFLVNFHEFCQ